jgi:hypothetical protein
MPARKRNNNTLSNRVNRLESVSRPEVKYNSAESGAFDTIGSVSGTLLKPQVLGEGVGRNQRIGDKCKTRNIRFQAIFKMPDAPANVTSAIRILVLKAKKTGVTTSDMPSWYGTVDEDKFFVVKDILTNVSALTIYDSTGSMYGTQLRKVKFNVPTGLRKLQYDGASNQSPLNNEYLIYMLAENQSPECAYNWQHYYIDN